VKRLKENRKRGKKCEMNDERKAVEEERKKERKESNHISEQTIKLNLCDCPTDKTEVWHRAS
jgi:hypothetical protein